MGLWWGLRPWGLLLTMASRLQDSLWGTGSNPIVSNNLILHLVGLEPNYPDVKEMLPLLKQFMFTSQAYKRKSFCSYFPDPSAAEGLHTSRHKY